MKKNKIIFICSAIFLFLIFSIFQYQKSKSFEVLSIKSPFEIVVDLNKNGVEDDNEVISILQGYEYISRNKVITENLDLKYNIQTVDLIALAYLTEKFVKDELKDKYITLDIENGKNIIYQGAINFNEKFLNSGLIFKDNKPVNEKQLLQKLDYIRKTNFVLYNAKSNKYHKLGCKYGLIAHNYVCTSRSQLPKGAKPCKFCSDKKGSAKVIQEKLNIKTKQIPLISTFGSIKILNADFTTKLKPDRNGNTDICKELVRLINNSQKSIDIAIYGYDRVPKIENAINSAIARGVKVRLVYDIDSKGSNIYANTMYFVNLIKNANNDKAPFVSENSSSYTNSIMHNKFYIFDDSIVVTGSANLSFTDMSGFNCNNVVLINSKQIAQIYKNEFEQMYNSKFHSLKQPIQNKENIVIGNSVVSVYFSPTDLTIEKHIIPLINNAKSYIYIPAFIITDRKFAQALIDAKNRGVDVKIILDATNAKNYYSKHPLLRENKILVKTETFAGKLHTKTVIIDDKYSIIGSMNFSKNGEKRNDENVLIIKNRELAIFNKNFFEYLWKKIDNYWLTNDANSEGLDSEGSCFDGIDNDYDGKTDMADEGCYIYRGKRVN